MKIALIGYGKMGKAIEEIAIETGHEIILKVNKEDGDEWANSEIKNADVAIEFTGPESAYQNIIHCFNANVPVVCGSTGWLEKYETVKKFCTERNQAFFYTSNFSIGVNIFFELNKKLAYLMNKQPGYDEVLIHECHHLQKLDAPSGTAITLANQIIEKVDRLDTWKNYKSDDNVTPSDNTDRELPVFSSREGDVPGTHIVKYFSDEDEIEIIHKAFNRIGFAKGALMAAEWIRGKKGVFGMQDLLSL
ncbi:MAG: 4-hydroxy-tetrahydrodipicolinate reductase [Bacteroidetes bacterium]|nr:MAG: 4-hydroxy-tetrahydrodipicolinate reductase [Bacteroidota bacterium]REJ99758.1 MAG: 4-hydroxy-tetrahydrodipicolinate reductase [Bacteroidota bacterium]REK34131.1 MAG: 4-hydroxy-tetrahydrodipicolinate reductase [Bacteroidota bacterium]REK50462.1 MAG: 4-hydroxy-tetrahydrodipicolinate reductase [Bacteroidota bacterium]